MVLSSSICCRNDHQSNLANLYKTNINDRSKQVCGFVIIKINEFVECEEGTFSVIDQSIL